MSGFGAAPVAQAVVNVFDGTRKLYSDKADLLITVQDGNHKIVSRKAHDASSVRFTDLPLFGNAGDNYTFLASAKHYKDAGFFPVKLGAGIAPVVDLMLIPNESNFNFAAWGTIKNSHPEIAAFLKADVTADAAAARYNELKEDGSVLACLLNVAASMKQILLPNKTALHYLKAVEWKTEGEHALECDRVYAWADPELIVQIEQAVLQRRFQDAPANLHPGATRSFKQVEFGEANVQVTLHENDRHEVQGTNCVLVECDIDYFRDTLAHLLLEVAVNHLGNMTNPKTVYALRWIAGRRAGSPEFDPPYTLQRA